MNSIRRKLAFWWMYHNNPRWDSGVSPPELMQFIHANDPGRALDLGCGTGTNVITLAHYGWEAHGIDFISSPIKKAQEKARQAGVEASFAVDDATNPQSPDGEYDLILDMGCFHSLDSEEKAAYRKALLKLLVPGGTYLLYGFIKHPDGASISTDDRKVFRKILKEVSSQEGDDAAGGRQSIWLEYLRPDDSGGIEV